MDSSNGTTSTPGIRTQASRKLRKAGGHLEPADCKALKEWGPRMVSLELWSAGEGLGRKVLGHIRRLRSRGKGECIGHLQCEPNWVLTNTSITERTCSALATLGSSDRGGLK